MLDTKCPWRYQEFERLPVGLGSLSKWKAVHCQAKFFSYPGLRSCVFGIACAEFDQI